MAEYIYSKVIPGKLLHIINRFLDIQEGREDVVPCHNFIQMATIRLRELQTFKPHKHKWKNSNETKIAQESWVVLRGRVKVTLYDIDNKILRDDIVLHSLDCSITLEGGHNYMSLDDDTVVYEYKTGPYHGQTEDKEFI
jgi:hypothetical protein